MVQRFGRQGRSGRELGRARLHGHQALRLRYMGEDARCAGQDVQTDGTPERILSSFHSQVVLLEGGAPRRGLRQGVRRSNALPLEERPRRQRRHRRSGRQARRGADRAPHIRDHHLEHLQELDHVVPRPAYPVQPVARRSPPGRRDTRRTPRARRLSRRRRR